MFIDSENTGSEKKERNMKKLWQVTMTQVDDSDFTGVKFYRATSEEIVWKEIAKDMECSVEDLDNQDQFYINVKEMDKEIPIMELE